MTPIAKLGTVLIAIALAIVASHPVAAQLTGDPGWRFEATPYLWAVGLDGKIRFGPLPKTDVDVGFSDILDRLDIGLMGAFEARHDRWGLLFDGQYIKVSDSINTPGPLFSKFDAEITQQSYALAALYRVVDEPVPLDLAGGVRYYHINADLKLTAGQLPGRYLEGTQSWWDPFIGVRAQYPFAERWSVVGYADIGGFGVGSDLTWQTLAEINYRFSPMFVGKFGYRYLHVDYSKGNFVYDMALSGPYLGLGIRF